MNFGAAKVPSTRLHTRIPICARLLCQLDCEGLGSAFLTAMMDGREKKGLRSSSQAVALMDAACFDEMTLFLGRGGAHSPTMALVRDGGRRFGLKHFNLVRFLRSHPAATELPVLEREAS